MVLKFFDIMANNDSITLITATTVVGTNDKKKKTLVNPEEKYNLKLIKKKEISHDTRLFTFELPSSDECLGLPYGQHVNLIAKIDGKTVIRSYTPVSSDDDKEGGKMTQHLESLSIGDSIDFRGPQGLIVYDGCGKFSVCPKKNSPPNVKKFKEIGLIGGGSGITPLYQIIKSVLKNPNDMTKMYLLYANQSENDILLREEFDSFAKDYPHKFSVWYTVDKANNEWKYSTGFINEEMIKKYLPPPSKDNGILMCGPPPMIEFACLPNLEKVGHDSENLLRF
uniref:NADH-cytochrome b5 reductase n=2 Tax=Strongyloides stercoralis TaxID=6248 RepID=A0A0K0ECW1_STRER